MIAGNTRKISGVAPGLSDQEISRALPNTRSMAVLYTEAQYFNTPKNFQWDLTSDYRTIAVVTVVVPCDARDFKILLSVEEKEYCPTQSSSLLVNHTMFFITPKSLTKLFSYWMEFIATILFGHCEGWDWIQPLELSLVVCHSWLFSNACLSEMIPHGGGWKRIQDHHWVPILIDLSSPVRSTSRVIPAYSQG